MAEINTDFDQIKQDLKTFLESQDELQDFDFEGSGLNVILDALAYNTTYQALTANFALSEAFLDSAALRQNVVAKAKTISYFPRQISSSVATINLSITPAVDPAQSITVAKGTRFTSSIDGQSFTFVTTDDVQLDDLDVAGTYEADININQGVFRTQTFVKTSDPTQRFVLIQDDVDASESFFSVDVRLSAAATSSINYSRALSVAAIDGDSTIYYIQEAENGNVEIYFGDDILGKAVVTNNAIDITYIATKGKDANDASVFYIIDNVVDNTGTYNTADFTITTILKAAGGADEEDVDSIKFNAPLVNTTQERAITVNDYRALILNRYPAIESLNVWGGEDNIPPQYGKVFIAVKPNYGLTISPATKLDISNTILDKYSTIGITPEILDAEYTYLNVTSLVTYDDEKTTLKIGELTTAITEGVAAYFSSSVSTFSTDFRFSKLTSYIDSVDASISGNVTAITLAKKIRPINSVNITYNLQYNSQIDIGSVISNTWIGTDMVSVYQIKDDSQGRVFFYKDDVQTGSSIGQVDYTNGIIDLLSAVFDVQTNQEVVIQATPSITDIKLITNNIMLLGDNLIEVEKLI